MQQLNRFPSLCYSGYMIGSARVLPVVTALSLLCFAAEPVRAQCVGDCNGDARVAIAELVRGVNILLGRTPVDACVAFDANESNSVAVNELVTAVRNALDGCPAPDVVLQVEPSAVLLGQSESSANLSVRAFTSGGDEVAIDSLDIEWTSSAPEFADVVGDSGGAVVTAVLATGSTVVTARLEKFPEIVSPLAVVTRATLHPEVELVDDSSVVFPPPNLPEGREVDPSEIPDFVPAPAGGGEAMFGGFSESEITALLDVTDDLSVFYPVVLRGVPPQLGQRLLASGGALVAGFVRSVETRGEFSLLQIEVAAPQELFETLDFDVSAEQLMEDGQLMPFDTSGWEAEVAELDEAVVSTTVQIPVGPFVCSPIGLGVVPTFTQSPAASESFFGPIWDGKLRVGFFEVEHFYFKIGFLARATFNPEIRLTNGISVSFICDLADRFRIKETIPITGPLAVLLAPYIEGLVSLPFQVGLSGGATSRYGLKVEVDHAYWTGGTYDQAAGWVPLCEDWRDCSRANHAAEVIWDADDSGTQATIEGDVATLVAADVGVQAGGVVFDKLDKIPGLARILSNAAAVLEEKGKVPILRARTGPAVVTRWHNASRTAFIENSEGAANVVVRGEIVARFEALNTYLAKVLGLGGVRELPLLQFDPYQFSPPYRLLREETLTVRGQRLSLGSNEVVTHTGEILPIVSTVERDFVNISLVDLFFTDDLTPHTDFPVRGEVWFDGQPIAELTPAGNEFTLSGGVEVTADMCSAAETGEVEIKLIAFNEMFASIPTANFVGRFRISCDNTNEAPVVDAGPDQTVEFPGPVTLNGMVTDDGLPDPPGEVTIGWSKGFGPGEVMFADPTSPVTTATFERLGTFTLDLRARDGRAVTRDEVVITVVEPTVAECDFAIETTELGFELRVPAVIDDRGTVEEDFLSRRFGGNYEGNLTGRSLVYDLDATRCRNRTTSCPGSTIISRSLGHFRGTVNANCTALESFELYLFSSNEEVGDPDALFEEWTVTGRNLPFHRETESLVSFSETGLELCDVLTSVEYRRVSGDVELEKSLSFSCSDTGPVNEFRIDLGPLD